jgi:hypothetical protein
MPRRLRRSTGRRRSVAPICAICHILGAQPDISAASALATKTPNKRGEPVSSPVGHALDSCP